VRLELSTSGREDIMPFKDKATGIFHMDFFVLGERIAKSCGTRDRREAERMETALRLEVKARKASNLRDMTLTDALDEGLRSVWKRGTQYDRDVEQRLGACIKLWGGETPLSGITKDHLNKLVKSLAGLAPATRNRYRAAVSGLLTVAHDEWGVRVPADLVFSYEAEDNARDRFLTDLEEGMLWRTQVAEAASKPDTLLGVYHLLCVFLVDTGLRVGEAIQLTAMGNFDRVHRCIRVSRTMTKNGKPRTIPLTRRALAIVEQRIDEVGEGALLFPLRNTYVAHEFKKNRKRMGLESDKDFTAHVLRHTCASRLVMAGMDLYRVKEWLGHSSIKVTERYAHLRPACLNGGADLLERR
jgi:integrase